jgi:hypothetical protein
LGANDREEVPFARSSISPMAAFVQEEGALAYNNTRIDVVAMKG